MNKPSCRFALTLGTSLFVISVAIVCPCVTESSQRAEKSPPAINGGDPEAYDPDRPASQMTPSGRLSVTGNFKSKGDPDAFDPDWPESQNSSNRLAGTVSHKPMGDPDAFDPNHAATRTSQSRSNRSQFLRTNGDPEAVDPDRLELLGGTGGLALISVTQFIGNLIWWAQLRY